MRAFLFALMLAAQARQPAAHVEFDVVGLKPADPTANGSFGRILQTQLEMRNKSLYDFMRTAYDLNEFQLAGGPKWADSAKYDLVAKYPSGVGRDQVPQMMQSMLADRFKVEFHRETRSIPEYALVVAKGGPKLQEASEDDKLQGGAGQGPRMLGAKAVTLATVARMLIGVVHAPVIDRTGLAGQYTLSLKFAPLMGSTAGSTPADDNLPDIFGALQQVGLKLETIKGGVEVLVIDNAVMPSEH